MKTSAIAAALALLLAAGGCEEQHVRITIEPRPDGSILRTARLWITDTEKPGVIQAPKQELVDMMKAQYEESPPTPTAAVVLRGVFTGVPPDLKHEGHVNRGGYEVWRSSLGDAAIYRERRPGPTDHHARLERLGKVIDLGAKFLATIARQQLEGEEGVEKLAAFLEGPFATDVKDIFVLLAGIAEPQDLMAGEDAKKDHSREKRGGSALALACQLLEERGYFRIGELPGLADEERAIEFFCRLIARRMGRELDEGLRKRLAFLEDDEKLEAAAEKALQTLGTKGEELTKELEIVGDEMLDFHLFSADPKLEYVLVLPPGAELDETSGRVDEEGRIHWQDRLDGRPVKALFYAIWTLPNARWQKDHLGDVALRGEPLGEYVFWLSGLSGKESRAWEEALEALRPGPGLKKEIAKIRVTPAGEEEEPEEGARILLEALGPDEE